MGKRKKSAKPPVFSLLDRFPATPVGHVAFLEMVRDEIHYAADGKRNQFSEKYSNDTVASMVRGRDSLMAEATQRIATLSELPPETVEQVVRILRRVLTPGTVERIDELLTPAVRALRDAWEDRDIPSPAVSSCESEFVEQILCGPDDAELSHRELALLDAYLKQPDSLAQMQREDKADETSELAQRKNKLKLIRDFNRNLRAATPAAPDSEPSEPLPKPPEATATNPANEPNPGSPTGFLGGTALADAMGIHATRRDAFFRQLERQRMRLGDDFWHEVREPRPNSPRYIYCMDSPKLGELAKAYKDPKPA